MAGIRIHGPDGSAFNFPEGTTEDDIAQAMDAHYGAGQGGQSAQGQSGWDAAALGALDTLTFGYLDEAGSGLDWVADKLPGGRGRSYDEILASNRGEQKGAQAAHPNAYLAGQIGGGVLAGVGTAGAGLSMAANAARGGASLARVAGGAAVDGLAMGALQGTGSGEGFKDRAVKGVVGGFGGLVAGGAAPYATAAGGAVLRAATAPIAARLAPGRYADEAIGATMRRAGLSSDDVALQLEQAGADGQGMFTVADALGREGGRRLSSIVRTPNDARQGVVDALTDRGLAQNERLASTLAEGFDAPDTAAQRTAALTARRSADADVNYGAARTSAGAVDPTPAIQAADDFLRPGMLGGLAPDSIEAAVSRARSYLTDGQSILSDFNAAFRAKQELDAMIEGAKPAVQRQIIPIRNALDNSLASASDAYSGARDVFRQQSRAIDAVGTGTAAASGRTRAADNIAAFEAMTPEEQAAFRAGYASPIIAGVEASPVGPVTDRARGLMTGKSAQEFPAFAAPGRGEQMTNRIARERRMSETNRAALGGSMTADNIADQNDLAQFDPGIIATAATSGPTTALMSVVARALNEGRGMPPQVANRVAQALMETDPTRARAALTASSAVDQALAARNARIIAALNATSAAGTGRLAAP